MTKDIQCRHCGYVYSSSRGHCPDCGTDKPNLEAENINFPKRLAAVSADREYWREKVIELEAANAELLTALKMTAQALSWLAFGECRGFTDNLPTALEATGAASAAIAKHGGAA